MPVISFANSKGGVGKSTSALVLSLVLAKHNSSVTLIDADPNQPLKRWVKRDPDRVPENLHIIPDVNEDTILNAIDEASSKDAFVIIDLEGSKNITVSYAIGRSNLVIIPIQGSQLDADQGVNVIKLIEREKQAFARNINYSILFTRSTVIQARDVTHVRNQLKENEINVLPTELMERSAFRTIFQLGGSIYDLTNKETSNPHKAIENAEAFTNSVVEMLG
ncbi:AAA family ATPase [Kiloniella sp.]|uniref:AAA family ATPase n=1 Tax=Kiloniella sp. TaxID=1938587 RepID=UPI003B02D614